MQSCLTDYNNFVLFYVLMRLTSLKDEPFCHEMDSFAATAINSLGSDFGILVSGHYFQNYCKVCNNRNI